MACCGDDNEIMCLKYHLGMEGVCSSVPFSVVKSAFKWVPNLPSPSTLSHCLSPQVQDDDKIGNRDYFSKEVQQERLTLLPGSELEV